VLEEASRWLGEFVEAYITHAVTALVYREERRAKWEFLDTIV